MRPHLPILFGVLSTGLAAGLLVSRWLEAPSPGEPTPALQPQSVGLSPGDDSAAQSERAIAELSLELAALRARVAELEQPTSREAVLATREPEPSSTEVSGPIPSADERAKILTVMEQLEAERRHEKELARAEKQQAEYLRRATKLSEALSLPVGVWSGPLKSRRGLQLYRVTDRVPGRVLPFAEAESRIRDELTFLRSRTIIEERVDALRAKYRVVIGDDS